MVLVNKGGHCRLHVTLLRTVSRPGCSGSTSEASGKHLPLPSRVLLSHHWHRKTRHHSGEEEKFFGTRVSEVPD